MLVDLQLPSVRCYLRHRGIGAVIPTRSDQPRQPGFDRQAYRERNRVERTVDRHKQFVGSQRTIRSAGELPGDGPGRCDRAAVAGL